MDPVIKFGPGVHILWGPYPICAKEYGVFMDPPYKMDPSPYSIDTIFYRGSYYTCVIEYGLYIKNGP